MATFIPAEKKTFKLNRVCASTWRQVFVVCTNPIFLNRTKKIYDRGSSIPSMFVGYKVQVFAGNKFHSRNINRWMVGYSYGEFSWTRKLALYKAKQLKKKKKK